MQIKLISSGIKVSYCLAQRIKGIDYSSQSEFATFSTCFHVRTATNLHFFEKVTYTRLLSDIRERHYERNYEILHYV